MKLIDNDELRHFCFCLYDRYNRDFFPAVFSFPFALCLSPIWVIHMEFRMPPNTYGFLKKYAHLAALLSIHSVVLELCTNICSPLYTRELWPDTTHECVIYDLVMTYDAKTWSASLHVTSYTLYVIRLAVFAFSRNVSHFIKEIWRAHAVNFKRGSALRLRRHENTKIANIHIYTNYQRMF